MRSLLAALLLLSLPLAAGAQDLPAREVVKKATESGAPDSLRQTVTMTLVDAKGSKSTRSLTISRTKASGTGDTRRWNTRVEFLSPKDVAGTVLLTLEKAAGGSDQYLYLPGLKRVRRIAGSQKSGSFQGSDFAYEDLGSRELDAADYRKLDDEKVGGDDCFQIEATPKKGTDTGYARTIADIRKSDFLTVRMRFFDAKNAELKTLTVDPAKLKTQGDIRIPLHLEMKTLKDGHQTVLEVGNVEIDPKLDSALFDSASLDKG